MLALCLMLLVTYYALNYAGIIGLGLIIVLNDVTSKSREQRLITKEHIATNANLILPFKPALYSSTSVIKTF